MRPYDHSKSKYSEAVGIDYETDRRNVLALFDAITRRLSADNVDKDSIRNCAMARSILQEVRLNSRELASACLRILLNSGKEDELAGLIAMNVMALLYMDRDKALDIAVTAARIVHDALTSESYSEACECIEDMISDGYSEEVLTTIITTVVAGAVSMLTFETEAVSEGTTIQ